MVQRGIYRGQQGSPDDEERFERGTYKTRMDNPLFVRVHEGGVPKILSTFETFSIQMGALLRPLSVISRHMDERYGTQEHNNLGAPRSFLQVQVTASPAVQLAPQRVQPNAHMKRNSLFCAAKYHSRGHLELQNPRLLPKGAHLSPNAFQTKKAQRRQEMRTHFSRPARFSSVTVHRGRAEKQPLCYPRC
jgi:hypothetical protein